MKKILLLLAKGFETYEASVFIDVMGWNFVDGDKNTGLLSCGLTGEVTSSFGRVFKPDFLIEEIDVDDYDALAVPGGFEEYGFYEDAYDERFLDIIRRFHRKKKIIASICVGALPLARSGILTGKNATTYCYNNSKRITQLAMFGANVVDEPMVIDDGIITSWNPATAVDVAFILLEMLTSAQNAERIRKAMGFGKTTPALRDKNS